MMQCAHGYLVGFDEYGSPNCELHIDDDFEDSGYGIDYQ